MLTVKVFGASLRWLVGTVAIYLFFLLRPGNAPAQLTNSWLPTLPHYWDVPGDWSLGVAPSNNQAVVLITNAVSSDSYKTINLDSSTPLGNKIISNLTVSAPAGMTNELSLNRVGATPLRILNGLTLGAGGAMFATNSTVLVEGMSGGNLVVNGRINLVSGGTTIVYTLMRLGDFSCTTTGMVSIAGGSLFVTNAARNAVLEVRSGTLRLTSGTVVVDQLIATNSCAVLQQIGGTLVVGGVTNPFFRVTAINREANNMRITWQTFGGVTNILQATTGRSYNTNFVDLPPQIIVTGSGLTTTNSLDVNGVTNKPARFYRVRLVP